MTTKYQVPERKPSEWELQQKAKVKTKVCRADKPYNSWGTPKDKQGMFKTKSV